MSSLLLLARTRRLQPRQLTGRRHARAPAPAPAVQSGQRTIRGSHEARCSSALAACVWLPARRRTITRSSRRPTISSSRRSATSHSSAARRRYSVKTPVSGSEARRESCERGLQKRAADAGISAAVTPAHIADPRVKARYETARQALALPMPNFVVDTLQLVDATVKSYTVTAWSNVASANATSLRLMLILYVALFGILVWYGALRLTHGPDRQAPVHGDGGVRRSPQVGELFRRSSMMCSPRAPDALAGALAGGGNQRERRPRPRVRPRHRGSARRVAASRAHGPHACACRARPSSWARSS